MTSWQQRLFRWRVLLVKRIRPTELQMTLVWAAIIGFFGAVAAVTFREMINGVEWLLTRHTGLPEYVSAAIPPEYRMWVPVFGGVVAGAILLLGARCLPGQRSVEYMEAISLGTGEIRSRATLFRAASSLMSIASGGSLGREGCIVQLAAMIGSRFGRWMDIPAPRLRLFVACGGAAGFAATFNAPVAGALFIAEIILGSIAMQSFGPLIFSAVVGTITAQQVFGTQPTFHDVRPFTLVSPAEMIVYLLLGILCGLGSLPFKGLLSLSRKMFRATRLPLPVCMGIGGLITGLISIEVPYVWGNGEGAIEQMFQHSFVWQGLLILLIAKLAATAATVGSGAAGGVITPTLMTGALLGALVGGPLHDLFPAYVGPMGGYALVGMGAFMAATTHAPLMAIMLVAELTGDHAIVLPLMLACVTSHYCSLGLGSESIYAESLRRRRGDEPPTSLIFETVRDVMKPVVAELPETATFEQVVQLFSDSRRYQIYVTGEGRRLDGVIRLGDIDTYLHEPGKSDQLHARDLATADGPILHPGDTLADAIDLFRGSDAEFIPVVDSAEKKTLLGAISKTDLLLAFAHGLGDHGEEKKSAG